MSYSFNVTATSKAEAKEKIAAQFDTILASQPVHAADRASAQAAAQSYVDMLQDPADGEEIAVSVNGYVSWRAEGEFTGASVGVTASVRAKAAA
jgi:hypothetical protein